MGTHPIFESDFDCLTERCDMKLLCQFSSAIVTQNGSSHRKQATKATVTLFQKDGVAYIQIFTQSSTKGDKFRIKGNIAKCLTKCINDGKLTIELVEPRLQLMISKGEPDKLRQLCNGLKKGLSGETLVGSGLLSSTITKPAKIGRTTKLRILSRADYKTKLSKNSGFPAELREFQANGLGLRAIDTRLFKLRELTVLDMTRNALEQINKRIYTLRLHVLQLADNQIKQLPHGLINSALAQTLQKLDLSHNQFAQVPKTLVHCKKLVHLELNKNQLIRVPDRLPPTLKHLSLRDNKITFCSLPRRHSFDHLDLTGNPFSMRPSDVIKMPIVKHVPKLIESAARLYLKQGWSYNNRLMAQYICDYLDKAIQCPCSMPIWRRHHLFLAEYDVRKYSKTPLAPRGNDFIVPQLEFCCSLTCLAKYKAEFEFTPPPEEEVPMQVAE